MSLCAIVAPDRTEIDCDCVYFPCVSASNIEHWTMSAVNTLETQEHKPSNELHPIYWDGSTY